MQEAIRHLSRTDPVLGALIERCGRIRVKYSAPDFETLAKSIVYQQLSGKSAGSIYARLCSRMPGGVVSAQSLLRLTDNELRATGLSRQKVEYLRDLAQRTARGEIDFSSLGRLRDEEVIAELTRVKGIGLWTAQMFLIFALRRPDVLPSGDLGIRGAIRKAYQLPALPQPRQVERMGEPWRPWCSVASLYLWHSVDNGQGW